jgi:hypothetical protein
MSIIAKLKQVVNSSYRISEKLADLIVEEIIKWRYSIVQRPHKLMNKIKELIEKENQNRRV